MKADIRPVNVDFAILRVEQKVFLYCASAKTYALNLCTQGLI